MENFTIIFQNRRLYWMLFTKLNMLDEKLSEIKENDILNLINLVHEGKTIEFKENYSLNSDREKGEFLADISSFANTLGGDLDTRWF